MINMKKVLLFIFFLAIQGCEETKVKSFNERVSDCLLLTSFDNQENKASKDEIDNGYYFCLLVSLRGPE